MSTSRVLFQAGRDRDAHFSDEKTRDRGSLAGWSQHGPQSGFNRSPTLLCCVPLGKLLRLSVPPLPHLYDREEPSQYLPRMFFMKITLVNPRKMFRVFQIRDTLKCLSSYKASLCWRQKREVGRRGPGSRGSHLRGPRPPRRARVPRDGRAETLWAGPRPRLRSSTLGLFRNKVTRSEFSASLLVTRLDIASLTYAVA